MALVKNGYTPLSKDDVVAQINAIFVNVFGKNFNTSPSSVNGLFIQELANIALENEAFKALILSSVYNPDTAIGIWLDSLCALLGIYRKKANYSTVNCFCYGSSGTVIPAGTLISSSAGDVFASNALGIIGADGEVEITFIAQNTGPVSVSANTVNTIINKVYGWDSVNNPVDGMIGNSVESDVSLRTRRTTFIKSQGSAQLDSIADSIYSVDGVTEVYPLENDTPGNLVLNGVTLNPNSVYFAVLGGKDVDIAQAIFNKKSPGSNFTGNTTVGVTNKYNTQTVNITFQRPVEVALQINISIGANVDYPANINTTIQNAVLDNFNNGDLSNNIKPVGIYTLINAFRFTNAILSSGVSDIRSITLQTVVNGTPSIDIQLPANQIATLLTSNIIITQVA